MYFRYNTSLPNVKHVFTNGVKRNIDLWAVITCFMMFEMHCVIKAVYYTNIYMCNTLLI